MLDDVVELTNVARPGGRRQRFERVGRDSGDSFIVFFDEMPHEVVGQQGNILAPLFQPRQRQGDDIQAVIQIFAEGAVGHGGFEIVVGRGQDAHVDRLGARGPDRPHRLFLQHAQQLDLQCQRHIADFIQKQGAAIGGLEQADMIGGRAGKRAAQMAEQFRFKQLFWNRAAVDGNEWRLASRAGPVDGARQHFLAGTAFTANQHTRIRGGDNARFFHQLSHAPAAVHDPILPVAIVVHRGLADRR